MDTYTLSGVDSGDGHWRTIHGSPVLIKKGESVADAIAERSKHAKPADSDHAAAVLDQLATPAHGSREGDYAKIKEGGDKFARGEDSEHRKGFADLHAESQERLKAQGVDHLTGYRGLEIPEDHPLAKALASGKLKDGDKIQVEHDGLQSFSESPHMAAGYANSPLMNAERAVGQRKTVGVVIQREIAAEHVVASHRTHTGFLEGEQEVVAKSGGKYTARIMSHTAKSKDHELSAAWIAPFPGQGEFSAAEQSVIPAGDDATLYRWKDVLACGQYVHPVDGQPFTIAAADLPTLEASFAEMTQYGDEPPIVKDHKETSDATLGYTKRTRIKGERLQVLHRFADVDSRNVALRNKVSVKLQRNYRMSNGSVLPLAITHVATTPRPVITQQDDWAIAASRGNEGEAPVFYFVPAPSGDSIMKATPEQLTRVKALVADATEETAFDVLLSRAESLKTDLDAKTLELSTATTAIGDLRKNQVPAIELSAATKTLLVESASNYIELAAVKGQWPTELTNSLSALAKADDGLLLSRDAAGSSRFRGIVDIFAPHVGKGLAALDKEQTGPQTITLSRVVPDAQPLNTLDEIGKAQGAALLAARLPASAK